MNCLPMAKHHIQVGLNLQHKVSLLIIQVVKECLLSFSSLCCQIMQILAV